MRIISKRQDYYDSIQRFGSDQNLIYNRKPERVNNKALYTKINDLYKSNYPLRINIYNESFDLYIIGFCGKLYPMFTNLKENVINNWNEEEYDFSPKTHNLKDIFFAYNLKDIDNIIDHIESLHSKKYTKYYKSHLKDYQYKRIREIFSLPIIENNDIFIELNSPIFMIEIQRLFDAKHYLHKDIILKHYQFYRLFDSYQAFQNIDNYLGSVLVNTKSNMVEISNKDKIIKHGFNKWNFRKKPKK